MNVSLNMIVRDGGADLRALLTPALVALFTEIVIVIDSRTTDDTREVAAELGARVLGRAWTDSFAAARNAAIEASTAPWIFSLDADDRIDPPNVAKLAALFGQLVPEMAYRCVSRSRYASGPGAPIPHLVLFPRLPGVRWAGRVHEQIEVTDETELQVSDVDVVIEHLGYLDPETSAAKADRNLALAELQWKERPGVPWHVLVYARALYARHAFAAAVHFLLAHGGIAWAREHLDVEHGRQIFYLWTDSIARVSVEAHATLTQIYRANPDATKAEFRAYFGTDLQLTTIEGTSQ